MILTLLSMSHVCSSTDTNAQRHLAEGRGNLPVRMRTRPTVIRQEDMTAEMYWVDKMRAYVVFK